MLLQFGKAIALFLIGGMLIHTLIMLFDYFLVPGPFYLNLRADFPNVVFSPFMIPMIGVYGLSLLTIYFLWEKKKNALRFAHDKEVQTEKVEIVFKAMQRLTAMMVKHIAEHNGEIINEVERRKRLGRPVSVKLEKASMKIAHALKSLSEISFVSPYSDYRPETVEGIEKMLQRKLDEVSAVHVVGCNIPIKRNSNKGISIIQAGK